MTRLGLVAFLSAGLFAGLTFGLDVSKLEPRGYVNDYAGVLDAQASEAIAVYCGNVESLEGDTVEDAAVRLFEKWGVGKKGKDEGILLLLAIKDRKNRIEVGYGLEPIVTDGAAGDVLRSIRPILRQGDYGGAINAALQQLGQRIAEAKGVTIDGQAPVRRRREGGDGGFPIAILVFIFIIFAVLSNFGGRGRPRGGGADMLAGMILGQMLGGGRRRGSGWSSGGFGGSGGGGGGGGWSGGGGFGGFGGGGSGGGGASGGW